MRDICLHQLSQATDRGEATTSCTRRRNEAVQFHTLLFTENFEVDSKLLVGKDREEDEDQRAEGQWLKHVGHNKPLVRPDVLCHDKQNQR